MLMKLFGKFKIAGTSHRIMQLKELRQMIIVAIMLVSLAFSIAIPVLLLKKMGLTSDFISYDSDKNIAVLHLDKQITIDYINQIIKTMDDLKQEYAKGDVTNVLIVASSPGGSPQGSDELANYLLEFQKQIPTTFYVEGVCASGCYYIASSMHFDKNNSLSGIIANPNSVVGSIGVVMPHLVYGPALNKHGIENEYLYVGKFKVPMDSWELASEESKKYLTRNILAPVYKTFRNFVQKHRNLDEDKLSKLDDGRVFISTLVEGSLVDRVSNLTTIKNELYASVSKKYPGESVGFAEVNIEKDKPSLLNSISNIQNLIQGAITQSSYHMN